MARTIITNVPITNPTQLGGTVTATNVEGVKESVEDIIALISPYETPFYSGIEKTGANDVVHYWQEDELVVPSRTNAKIQGWEPVALADWNTSSPGMKGNYIQLAVKTARVSGTAKRVDLYGRGDELDYEIMKRGREIRRDIESSMLADSAGVAPATAAGSATYPNPPTGTAGRMTGAPQLIHTANQVVHASGGAAASTFVGIAGAVNGSGATGPLAVTAGTGGGTLTEALVLSGQKRATDAGGSPNVLMVSPYHAAIVANFAYIDPTASLAGARTRIVSEGTLYNIVDIYHSPHGTLSVVQNKFMQGYITGDSATAGVALILEMDKWAVGQLRPITSERLAKTGDNDKSLLTAEMTLIHRHTKASAVIRDLTVVAGVS